MRRSETTLPTICFGGHVDAAVGSFGDALLQGASRDVKAICAVWSPLNHVFCAPIVDLCRISICSVHESSESVVAGQTTAGGFPGRPLPGRSDCDIFARAAGQGGRGNDEIEIGWGASLEHCRMLNLSGSCLRTPESFHPGRSTSISLSPTSPNCHCIAARLRTQRFAQAKKAPLLVSRKSGAIRSLTEIERGCSIFRPFSRPPACL